MSGPGSGSMAVAPAAASALSFRPDLRVYPPRPDSGDSHYTIYDPASDLSYFLGANELMVARLFDGQRSLVDIMAHLESQHRRRIPLEKLAAFEKRLHQLDMLSVPGAVPDARVRDPAAGISYGPLKSLLIIPLLRMQPAALLDYVYERFGWLCSRAFVYSGLFAILAAIAVVVVRYGDFSGDVVAVYGNGIGWLACHYPVVVASIAVHELGHALACRLYRVRVTDFGIAIYLLMATGWARPLQGDWTALARRERMITIVMGPYASLLFSAAGVALWLVTVPGSPWHTLSVVMTASASLSLIPTLLPIFNGDTYLALTEYLRVPRLRQRAFQYVKETLWSRKHDESPTLGRRALYWITVVATSLGWLLAWALLLSLLARIFRL
ncbi:M50 family metallopeptidase [Verminephrobacter eiseniae]|uniref:M50 family metallopeptidase n=1 Tax=Verminephrobacter eiseniae TaxID=364317 RepID=UPI002237A668|nr:M50 family metallopeptidase [Verminephrobacter eiseniae]MCW5236569.1 M50 family peptidase [Verminephrobacter eiseniae]